MTPTLEAVMAGETLAEWPHYFSPLDCWSAYETITDGLVAVKRERQAALAAHDHGRVAELAPELIDLTYLAGSLAEGLARQKLRFIEHGLPWPLGRLYV